MVTLIANSTNRELNFLTASLVLPGNGLDRLHLLLELLHFGAAAQHHRNKVVIVHQGGVLRLLHLRLKEAQHGRNVLAADMQQSLRGCAKQHQSGQVKNSGRVFAPLQLLQKVQFDAQHPRSVLLLVDFPQEDAAGVQRRIQGASKFLQTGAAERFEQRQQRRIVGVLAKEFQLFIGGERADVQFGAAVSDGEAQELGH
ncbi:hypothetical protein YQE_06340, partial [Dendroctonus ponderosae]